MNEFQVIERTRAFARTMGHLTNALALVRAAEHENTNFSLGLGELVELDRKLMHEIHCCAHVYKSHPEQAEGQPPEAQG